MTPDFRRVAIVNRGEAAMRFIRAARELGRDGEAGIHTIALYTDPDVNAAFVRNADEAVSLGSATFVSPADGRRRNRYLDYEALERALVASRAEAVWVGWGFVAEHADFAEQCRKLGVVFIGPDPEVMRALGDKIGSKRMAEKAGVPVAPWSGGPVECIEEALEQAHVLGYPLMIKATAGGGGRGIRRVLSEAELGEAFTSARSEARASFGDGTVFMERLVEGARHVEVQILGDGQGQTWALGVRDCSVQRRNQKVIEETPSPGLDAEQQEALCAAAARLGTEAGYRGAGTVEFLYDAKSGSSTFMEVNARLQVEHPVTELTTGVDLVKLQIHVARGHALAGDPPPARGHAIEVRVNAEDPERGFAPAPGTIELFRLPGGPGLRIDSGFLEGDRVAPEFDSMLAKVIAWGADRDEALARLRRALAEMRLAVRGGANNRGFLLDLLDRPEVRSGQVDVGWLDRLASEGRHLSQRHADVALVAAAIEAYEMELSLERARFYATAARGRLKLRREVGFEPELRCRGVRYAMRVCRVAPQAYRIETCGHVFRVDCRRLGRCERRLTLDGVSYQILTLADGPDQLVEVDGSSHRVSRDDLGMVRAPAPAVVLALAVRDGDEVSRGDRLAVLEAMKSEMPVLAPCRGRIRQVMVSPNVQVDAGAPLFLIDPSEDGAGEEEVGERIDFGSLAAPGAEPGGDEPVAAVLEALRELFLGFDADAAEVRRLSELRERLSARLPAADPELLAGERRILRAYADLGALFESRTAVSDLGQGESRTPEEYLLLYLRSLDPAAAGVSPSFVDRLTRALSHYGVDRLERCPELEETLLWICRGHAHVDDHIGVVMAILNRWLEHADELAGEAGPELRDVLERIATVARGRHQAVSDLAQEVRYVYFDRPFFQRIQDQVYANAEAQLAAAAREAGGRARAQRVRALVDCPQPLAPLLAHALPTGTPTERELMIEVLLRRYYRIRPLEHVQAFTRGDTSLATGEYLHPDGAPVNVVGAHVDWDPAEASWQHVRDALAEVPSDREVVLELFVQRGAGVSDADRVSEEVRSRLDALASPRRVRRCVVLVVDPEARSRGLSALLHLTFRPGEDGFVEERVSRDLHPMMAKRLQLWRLDNFELERLPSVEDVYLFHGVARSNPKDERLFAFAEVRDLTPMRDESDEIVALPHLERQFMEALAAIRLYQSRRSSRNRLHWNRVVLHVWPPLELAIDELQAMAHRLLPAADGLGLQKTVVRARVPRGETGELRDTVIQIGSPGGGEVALSFRPVADRPIAPLSEYGRKLVRMRQRGLLHPFELLSILAPEEGVTGGLPRGDFVEYDLDEQGALAPVEREPGQNQANLVLGVVRNFTAKHPEGMARVLVLGDPSREMGSFAEPECRRLMAAVDLAEQLRVPLEWFPVSAGAKIAMDSGTENLDWTAAVLRRLIEFTQEGGEVNVVVTGINVGGQSYWNAEATMLMHNRGILVMTPDASMVLTGKKALDYSGGVSAEDHPGIGGYDRIMGVNGEAQYWARDVADACRVLLRYYDHAYVAPGERFPRRAPTEDPTDRDVRSHPYGEGDGTTFKVIGDVFGEEGNPGRRKPFDVRRVMQAVIDQDHDPLERWVDMREAEIAVVWDAHLGGIPVCLLGIESHPMTRLGFVPADGPEQWTAGTLFPLSSKKVARAINAASGSRPVVILANLSGFDGSPESLRRLQLEYGAEIGRAVVNFDGPLVFCVISRYHGGAYVVFSRRLNENLQVAALEGSYASVIGGAPAAAVVFAGEVERRTRADGRLVELESRIADAAEADRGRLRVQWHELYEAVHSEKLGEVADEFDHVHDVARAQRVGSLDEVVEVRNLRSYLVRAVERGMRATRSR